MKTIQSIYVGEDGLLYYVNLPEKPIARGVYHFSYEEELLEYEAAFSKAIQERVLLADQMNAALFVNSIETGNDPLKQKAKIELVKSKTYPLPKGFDVQVRKECCGKGGELSGTFHCDRGTCIHKKNLAYLLPQEQEKPAEVPCSIFSNSNGKKIYLHTLLKMIDNYWRFDEHQKPMSSWHEKQDLFDEIRKLF